MDRQDIYKINKDTRTLLYAFLAAFLVLDIIVLFLWLPADKESEAEVAIEAEAEMESPAPIDFNQYAAGKERKNAFFGYFGPLVQAENRRIERKRKQLLALQKRDKLSKIAKDWTEALAKEYKVRKFDIDNAQSWQQLLDKVDIIPPSLALAQSANESAWGTSRFAKQGQNYFGQWCFTVGCGIVPRARSAGATHEVAKFESPMHSVRGYLYNLNANQPYKKLRAIRSQLRSKGIPLSGTALAEGLMKYSARGADYITELQAMIRHNKLQKWDDERLGGA